MKKMWSIRFLCGITMQNHHCLQRGKKPKQSLTSLADSAPSLSSFPSATASHSWESMQVSGPSGPRAHKQTGVEVAGRRLGGSKLYVRTSGTPISVCVSAEQMSYCSSSSSPFMTTPPSFPPSPSAGNRRVQGWQ